MNCIPGKKPDNWLKRITSWIPPQTKSMTSNSPSNRLLLSLVHLRSNALAAIDLTSGRIASPADIEALDAIAQEAFGISLDKIQCVPDEGASVPVRETLLFLEAFMPGNRARQAARFLKGLEERILEWLSSDSIECDTAG